MTTARRALPHWSRQWWLWFAAIFLITFSSFWPSFFSAISKVKTPIIVHGVSATAWMLLMVIQAALLKSRWRKNHRTLGYASLALAAIVVLSGVQMLQNMVLRDGGDVDGIPLLGIKFFYVDLTGLILFCVFLGLAIKAARHRDIPLHLRLITCTAIIPLEAALERSYLYGTPQLVPDFEAALFASNLTLIVLTAALAAGECWYRRLRWPFGVMFVYYLIMLLTTDAIARAEWFQSGAFGFADL